MDSLLDDDTNNIINDPMGLYISRGWSIQEGQLLFLIFNALVLGLGKGGVPGLATVATALTVATSPSDIRNGLTYAVALQVPILTIIDISAAWLHSKDLVWPPIYVLVPFSMIGMVIGQIADKYYLNDSDARLLVGVLLLVILGFQVMQSYFLKKNNKNKDEDTILPVTTTSTTTQNNYFSSKLFRWGSCVGVLGGAATMLTNAMGPILNVYLLSIIQLNPSSYIGTRAMFFCIANVWKLPVRFLSGSLEFRMLPLAFFLGIFSVIGVFGAKPILLRIPPKHFVLLELGVVFLAGIRLCYMGLFP
mmetsp:Transcript_26763/g.29607  ORF Transcript_26763/g.29607 Transcript_26763/m.29607 type:complete len:305 (+) Transcript_26763:63-977(+)